MNLARAVGPALAGLLLARVGVAVVFALNALLPIVASRRLELGAGGYGLLLAAVGAGADADLDRRIRSLSKDEPRVTHLLPAR